MLVLECSWGHDVGYVLSSISLFCTHRKPVGTPYVIKVQQGKRYRMRAIQGAASWGLKVKAPPGHSMTVIALDGSNVAATPAKGFVFTPGERVDFILHANQVRGLGG